MLATPNNNANLTVYFRGQERYVFLWETQRFAALQQTYCRFACNPDLAFTIEDALVLNRKIRELMRQQGETHGGD